MPLSQQDADYIIAGLNSLYERSVLSIREDHAPVRSFIDAGEFGLALDLLACIQLHAQTPASQQTIDLFVNLARKMKIDDSDDLPDAMKMLEL